MKVLCIIIANFHVHYHLYKLPALTSLKSFKTSRGQRSKNCIRKFSAKKWRFLENQCRDTFSCLKTVTKAYSQNICENIVVNITSVPGQSKPLHTIFQNQKLEPILRSRVTTPSLYNITKPRVGYALQENVFSIRKTALT
jgi:hypothetical protein